MKKLLLLSVIGISLFSCDQILKDRKDDDVEVDTNKNVVLGTTKDANGCVTSAGYRWSLLRKECIRGVEEGYRLNSIDELQGESTNKSAFVIFEEDGDRAELFLPDETKSILLTREKKGAPYKDKHWILQQSKSYSLKKNGVLMYAGAEIEEGQITGDEDEQS